MFQFTEVRKSSLLKINYFVDSSCLWFQYSYFIITMCELICLCIPELHPLLISIFLLFLMPSESCMDYREY